MHNVLYTNKSVVVCLIIKMYELIFTYDLLLSASTPMFIWKNAYFPPSSAILWKFFLSREKSSLFPPRFEHYAAIRNAHKNTLKTFFFFFFFPNTIFGRYNKITARRRRRRGNGQTFIARVYTSSMSTHAVVVIYSGRTTKIIIIKT